MPRSLADSDRESLDNLSGHGILNALKTPEHRLIMRFIQRGLLPGLTLLLLLAGCAATPHVRLPEPAQQQRVAALGHAIVALDATIDPAEASRVASVAIGYSQQLAREYEISSSPVVHNLLVNLGIKPRGLCIHWTEDLMARLQQEDLQTLDLHWAIANDESPFRLEHSTVVVSAEGESLYRGLVLDPWRNSGRLHWAPTLQDLDYPWKPREIVHERKRERLARAEDRRRDR